MRTLRILPLLPIAVTAVATTLVTGAFSAPATAAVTPTGIKVLLLTDPTYVDVGTAEDVANEDYQHEGINMQLALTAAGNTVTTVDTTSAAAFSAALAGQHVFVVPETEETDLGEALDSDTIAVVRNWVSAGGTLIAADDYSGNLDALFGYTLAQESTEEGASWDLTSSPGATFAGGPASLPYADGSDTSLTSSLPAGAVPVYASTETESTAVFDAPYGSGNVVYLAYDWYDAAPADPEGQDGGWNDVLQRAVLTGKPAPTPAPVTAPGAVRKLHLTGKKTAATRKIVWTVPASNGGSAITRYVVVVTQKGRTVLNRTVGAGTLKVSLRSKTVARAKTATVKVRAVNKAGAGAWTSTGFATVKR